MESLRCNLAASQPIPGNAAAPFGRPLPYIGIRGMGAIARPGRIDKSPYRAARA